MKSRIIYMGTPEFAIPPLKALLDEGYNIVGVITAPDKPAGRGKKLMSPPVKIFAKETGLNVLQPENLKDPDFNNSLKLLDPDLQIVVAFRMLPEVVWSLPKSGTFNLHASLLPQYRGAAPINWTIINGDKITGLTTFFIDEKIDTGEILLQESIEIGENESAGELHDRMTETGASLVVKTVKGILEENIQARKQDTFNTIDSNLKPAPKIFKEDCRINWDQKSIVIHNLIRGLSPYPAAFSTMKKNDEEISLKIFKSRYQIVTHNEKIGSLSSLDTKSFRVAVSDGYIEIIELQLAGKKRMDTKSFLLGFKDISKWTMQ